MRPPPRTIAVDIDDTLNDFTATLQALAFPYDARFQLPEEAFEEHLAAIRSGAPASTELLSSAYSFLRYKVHEACYRTARPRSDGVAFMKWLNASGWCTIICTRRDLRRAGGCTRRWLGEHGIPYDFLFGATNKVAFCRAWEVPYLVDDDESSIAYGPRYGVQVFHPLLEGRAAAAPPARGFHRFDELRRWIAE